MKSRVSKGWSLSNIIITQSGLMPRHLKNRTINITAKGLPRQNRRNLWQNNRGFLFNQYIDDEVVGFVGVMKNLGLGYTKKSFSFIKALGAGL